MSDQSNRDASHQSSGAPIREESEKRSEPTGIVPAHAAASDGRAISVVSADAETAGAEPPILEVDGHKKYFRFNRSQRIEHFLLLASFTILGLTGIPQKYAGSVWAITMIDWMGGIELIRIIHRIAAVVLILETIYHGGVVTYKIFVKRVRLTMLPTWKDVTDGLQSLAYNIGILKEPPKMPRYNFGEKLEYWAVIWGTAVMVITGFMLWNPIATTRWLPGQAIPAALAAHSGEGLLAVVSIIIWHMYFVHIKFFNKSMFTGYLDRHVMEEEHALELEEIERGYTAPSPDPRAVRRRTLIFTPIAVVISVALLVGLFYFVTLEETAIATVPQGEEIEIFLPAQGTPDAFGRY